MREPKTVEIVGGGLAGLTLGIALSRLNVPVIIHEAGGYPRHRVCGEFICGRGLDVLKRLELTEQLFAAGAMKATTVAFFLADGTAAKYALPTSAICLSRFQLDALLAHEFQKLGGKLNLQSRWSRNDFPPGVVRAIGRRVKTNSEREKWFGLKIHARDVALEADLEMHLSSRGYIGICRVTADTVNICGLFWRRAGEMSPTEPLAWLTGEPGSALHGRLAKAKILKETFCSVAGLSLTPLPAVSHEDFCIGDAVTMIPPVTGNGMSMAFESADLATAPLSAWSGGDLAWPAARQIAATACDNQFCSRLRWAGLLQKAVLTSQLQWPLVKCLQHIPALWRLAFSKTR